MNLIEAIILGIIQGLSEFIPISSSGHLLLGQYFLGVQEAGLTFDVALHIGTFIALVTYFYKDIGRLVNGFFGKNELKNVSRLIMLATIPAVVAGFLVQDLAETTFRSPYLVSLNLIWVAVAMILAENYSTKLKEKTDYTNINTKQAVGIGFAQALALIPGISRSGSTITAGIFAGLDRVSATRFSFLMALPVTFGAIIKVVLDPSNISSISNESGLFMAGIISAFVSGYIAIRFLISYLSRHSIKIFAYYRIILGIIVLLTLAI